MILLYIPILQYKYTVFLQDYTRIQKFVHDTESTQDEFTSRQRTAGCSQTTTEALMS